MTLAELVEDTRNDIPEMGNLELLDEYSDLNRRLMALEDRLDAITEEARRRGFEV
jgi:hypothetical protein